MLEPHRRTADARRRRVKDQARLDLYSGEKGVPNKDLHFISGVFANYADEDIKGFYP